MLKDYNRRDFQNTQYRLLEMIWKKVQVRDIDQKILILSIDGSQIRLSTCQSEITEKIMFSHSNRVYHTNTTSPKEMRIRCHICSPTNRVYLLDKRISCLMFNHTNRACRISLSPNKKTKKINLLHIWKKSVLKKSWQLKEV